MKIKSVIALSMAGLMLAACAEQQYGAGGHGRDPYFNKTNVGTLAGAAGGAALGSTIGKGRGNIAAIAIGTLLGAGLGREIGSSLDRADLSYYNQTSQQAMEYGQPGTSLPWRNPQSGNSGTITPSNYYETAQGQYCREYSQTINVGGRSQQGYGTACRQPDGTWKIVE